jgi:ligand-binding sensor domain-containing protein
MPLVHHVFSVQEENEFYQKHPGIHLVKAIVQGDKIHIWVADGNGKDRYNGQHLQKGGAPNY